MVKQILNRRWSAMIDTFPIFIYIIPKLDIHRMRLEFLGVRKQAPVKNLLDDATCQGLKKIPIQEQDQQKARLPFKR